MQLKLTKETLEKLVLGVIVVVITMIILVYLVFRPNINKIRSLHARLVTEKKKVLLAEEETGRLSTLRDNLEKTTRQIKQYEEQMPQNSPDWLLGILNSLAAETGINFDKIEPQGCIRHWGPYDLQGIELALRTGYHKLGRFINRLEQTSDFLELLDFDITGNDNDVSRSQVRLVIGAFVIAPGKEEKIDGNKK